MRYLVDTNALVQVLRGPGSAVEDHLRALGPDDVGVSAVVMHELYYGASRSTRPEANLAVVEEIGLTVVELTRDDAREPGRLRAALATAGLPIESFDVLITGQALSRGLTLVTLGAREFARAEGLAVEDWS